MIGPKQLVLFVIGLCVCNYALSQPDKAYFTQLTTMDGLSSNSIEAIYQDHQGLMWIKTLNGLDRYDGVEFINHHTYPEGRMESGPYILEDSLGNIWYNSALTKYDRTNDTSYLMQYKHLGVNIFGIMSAQMGPDHHLYLATWRNLWITNPYGPDTTVECVFPDENTLPVGNFTKIVFDSNDQIWLGTNDGLFRYDQVNRSLLPFDEIEYPKSKYVNDFLFDKEGNLWIIFNNQLVKYNFQRQSAEYYRSPNVYYGFFKAYQSSNGNILLGARMGLYYLEPGQDQIRSLLENVFVTSICEDSSHNLWIGTHSEGVLLGNTEFNAVQNLSLNIGNQVLSSYSVNGILKDSSRGLWINEMDHGLLYHDFKTGQTSEIDKLSGLGEMLYLEKKRQFWYSENDLLLCYYTDNGSIQRFKIPDSLYMNGMEKWQQYKTFTYMDELLLCTQNSKFYSFSSDSEEYKLVLQTDTTIRDLVAAKDKLYIRLLKRDLPEDSDLLGDLIVADSAFEIIDTLSFNENVVHLFDYAPIVLHMDRFDTLWLGGWGGLCKLNTQTREFETAFDFQHTNVTVINILEDSHGNLWIGSTNGLYKYSRQSGQFTHMGPKHGLPDGRFWVSSSAQSRDGQMYFGYKEGIFHFHPDKIPANTQVPPIILTGFMVLPRFNRSEGLNEQTYQSLINKGQEIHLKYWQNSFTVKYAALNYISPRHNQYQYRLKGLEEEWNRVGNQSRATYTSLRGGNYTFEVMGSNNEGVWNDTPHRMFIHVDSPPWWTWWSITLYVLVLLGVMLAIYLYNIRRIRLQYQLELKSKESESLMEINRAKSQFFTNISHEFRTPLSLILDPAEQLLNDKQTPPKQKRFAKLILNNSKRLLFLTNQILDLAKLDNNRIILKVEKTDLRELLNPTVQAFKSGAEAMDLDYRIMFPDKALVVWVDRDRIEQVVVNLLSNAFKFCTRGEIAIELLERDDSVWIHVRDTGLGIPAEKVDHIFENYYQVESDETKHSAGTGIGLYLVKQLVTLHHGSVHVESEVNKGSAFSVCLQKGKKHFLSAQLASGSLPAEEATEHPDEQSDHNLSGSKLIPHTKNPSLLIIEDNPEMMQYLAEVLSDEYAILLAKDGEEGFRRALELNPDVVISDVMMPVMDGYAFCEKMKKDIRTSHIPVILLTAKTMHKDKINGLQLGADDYLQKPFHLDELKLRIRYHLELRKKIQEEFMRSFKINSETELALSVNDQLLQTVLTHIEEHLHDDQFGVEKLSKLAGMSRKHLNNKIKSLTNQTTNELIRSFRLRKAAYLLSEKGITVSVACYQVGFSNLSYFSKCFAELYGTRPSDFSKSGKH